MYTTSFQSLRVCLTDGKLSLSCGKSCVFLCVGLWPLFFVVSLLSVGNAKSGWGICGRLPFLVLRTTSTTDHSDQVWTLKIHVKREAEQSVEAAERAAGRQIPMTLTFSSWTMHVTL